MTAQRVLREPLLHFLAAGAVLFAVFGAAHRPAADASSNRTIAVDERSLLNFLQYRSKAFRPEYFTAQLASMSVDERKSLEDEYVEEEMLYREATSLGLEQGDYVIRQRLVQKMRFLMDDLVDTGDRPSDATLEAYLRENGERYVLAPSVTFTHVFLDVSMRGDDEAHRAADRLKVQLNTGHAAFSDAPRFGDRFPFLQNYVERTFDYVASQFGNDFTSELRALQSSDTRWMGPIRSTYGYHLVLVTHRTEARLPALAEIRQQVEDDWLRDRREGAREQAMVRLASQYHVDRNAFRGGAAR